MSVTWTERAAVDPTLRAFVDAEIARAHVELSALRVEVAHQRNVIAAQAEALAKFKAIARDAARQHTLKGATA